jgi:ABC-type multidrug transport system ATPase subunit
VAALRIPAMAFEAHELSKEVGGRELYRDLAFRLEEGETLAIRGPSGAGKSQLLRQLACLDPDQESGLRQSGELRLRGRGPQEWGPQVWRSEVCYVPQIASAVAGTAAELEERIRSFRVQGSREASDPYELAEQLGMAAATWTQPWTELSVGERQRLLLAILVSRQPAVLLLDEPTAALDPTSIEAVEEILRDRTCVWVTHSGYQVERVADEVLVLGEAPHAD